MKNDYYDGLNIKLYESIPKNSLKILELGCANGRLGELYKKNNPETKWIGIDFSEAALNEASNRLDHTFCINLNKEKLQEKNIGKDYDVIVMGNVLEHLVDPEAILEELHELASPNGKIICCLPNMGHYTVVQKIISGDITYDANGLLDRTHLRLYSQASSFKLFLDAGWIPNLKDQYQFGPPASDFLNGIAHSAKSIGIPLKTALRNLSMYQMIIECKKREKVKKVDSIATLKISVVIAVNREWEFEENIKKSIGLTEIDAEIIPVRDAKSASEAFETGKLISNNEYILFTHQDVYFPKGSGFALLGELKKMEEENGKNFGVMGFAGLGKLGSGETVHTGFVIDRVSLFNHKIVDHIISIDEFAVVLHRNSQLKIDESLGWHNWATDLCIQTMNNCTNSTYSKIMDVPVFHNSLNDYTLSNEFYKSAAILFEKYPDLKNIETLCCQINEDVLKKNINYF
jgi:SAM-dependent methyltransferase